MKTTDTNSERPDILKQEFENALAKATEHFDNVVLLVSTIEDGVTKFFYASSGNALANQALVDRWADDQLPDEGENQSEFGTDAK